MESLSMSALGMAILLHSVMGVSYYFLLARCSPAPLLGSWLFVACIGAVLQAVHIFPQWCRNCSALFRLTMETAVCCITLDLMLTKLWCRIEALCHCAIIGILQHLVTDDRTFASCEYWMLGLTTSIIGCCLLWFTLWATALPNKLHLGFNNWQRNVKRSVRQNICQLAFGLAELQDSNSPQLEESQMLGRTQVHSVLLLVQLLVLPLFLDASPVSSPEIVNKSAKSPNSVLAQQQSQQLKSSSNGQESHLNSLSAFATSYDSLANTQPQLQPTAEAGFKPSYKMPEMETNFTPMQSGSIGDGATLANIPSTPMLMQYMPAQTLQDGTGTVQYLQLIPTRPIIVPISPFLTAAGPGSIQGPSPALTATPDFATRGSAVQLGAVPSNAGLTGLHYASAGLQGYASSISPVAAYRSSYRINREAKDKHFPPTFSLNLNEYLPSAAGGHEATAAAAASHPHTQLYIRARS
ncbi:hypothetical protein ACLKA7_007346 [Drosophila subpalustris]